MPNRQPKLEPRPETDRAVGAGGDSGANDAADMPLVFIEDEPDTPAAPQPPTKTWKVLIADDDEEVHTITQLVLRDLVFEDRRLELLSAHSGTETLRLLQAHPDIAVVLLDVVMETEDAGLAVVRKVRETLGNRLLRIILRTGQPGQAPERKVVVDYDINDYKEKTELTAQKLVTAVISALRSHRDILTIERSRQGLAKIIDASRDLFEPQSLARLSSGVLQQLTALLHLGDDSILLQSSGLAAKRDAGDHGDNGGDFQVLAGTGRFASSVGQPLGATLTRDELERLLGTQPNHTRFENGEFIGRFQASSGSESFILVQTAEPRHDFDANLLRLFSANIGIAFDNVHLHEELAATQAELVHTLSEVVETRSHETGRHVFRVGELSRLLAQIVGHDERDCLLIRQAAPMHDLGKIAIPDEILNKPGSLDDMEWAIMRGHASIGHQLLRTSRRPALQAAAIIAEQHHEWWDGSGYPAGKKGEEIHPFGRIVALIDVFDALSHPRCYKEAWEMPRVIEHIRQQRGRQFDPRLADAFLDHVDEFIELWRRYPNQP